MISTRPNVPADDQQGSLLNEFIALVLESDDANVLNIMGMTKENLLQILERDIGQNDQEMSSDLRGRLKKLFEIQEKEAAEDLKDSSENSNDAAAYLERMERENEPAIAQIVQDTHGHQMKLLREAHQEIEAGTQGEEATEIERLRSGLKGRQNPSSK